MGKDLEFGVGNDNVEKVATLDGISGLQSKKLTVAVEGPYGLPSIDLISGGYSVFLLIAGGIGDHTSQHALPHLTVNFNQSSSLCIFLPSFFLFFSHFFFFAFAIILSLLSDVCESSHPSPSHASVPFI